jgi:hypothetical protein
MNNIWILTEEKPKASVAKQILSIYKSDFGATIISEQRIEIVPEIINGYFKFRYFVKGIKIKDIDNIYIKIVSGSSSFTDFLLFVQQNEPVEGSRNDNLVFAMEETKTSDDESRNTGVFQRCSKFVYIRSYYNVPLYMLYNDEAEVRESKKPSDTSIFGTNLLLTIGVKIVGKQVERWFYKFKTIDEMISFKNNMRKPPEGNTPIEINKYPGKITISGRLDKPQNIGRISHDPNIGALSIIAYTLRYLGWKDEIVITRHSITQTYINSTNGRNKFLYIANIIKMRLDGLNMPNVAEMPELYWYYEKNSEKVASILFHVLSENEGLKEIYQNHAGCERGYFKTLNNELITLPKVTPSNNNLLIPDVIVRDDLNKKIVIIEGKKISTIQNGLAELNGYDDLESLYIGPHFPSYTVERKLTIFGGNLQQSPHPKVTLYLSDTGYLIRSK